MAKKFACQTFVIAVSLTSCLSEVNLDTVGNKRINRLQLPNSFCLNRALERVRPYSEAEVIPDLRASHDVAVRLLSCFSGRNLRPLLHP